MDTHEYKFILRNIGERERERENVTLVWKLKYQRERELERERERYVNNMDICLKKWGDKDIIGGIMDIHHA